MLYDTLQPLYQHELMSKILNLCSNYKDPSSCHGVSLVGLAGSQMKSAISKTIGEKLMNQHSK